MKCSAIVVAGGSGTRYGSHKQFAVLGGKTVAAWSVEQCRGVADQVILVVPAGMTNNAYGADLVVEGGPTRSESVRAGLALVAEESEYVVIHDAARPLASERLFFAVVAELADDSVDGAIPGIAVVDTIKEVEENGTRTRAIATLDRSALVAVQTPQAFRLSALRAAHAKGGDATDDSALVEANEGVVVVINGEDDNIKLTAESDLALLERILEERA
jgi:2-C-methyl-D-erythritol 4-phosphate cytidylyltransferase